jgi:serine/threonine protein phosphatase PrpC
MARKNTRSGCRPHTARLPKTQIVRNDPMARRPFTRSCKSRENKTDDDVWNALFSDLDKLEKMTRAKECPKAPPNSPKNTESTISMEPVITTEVGLETIQGSRHNQEDEHLHFSGELGNLGKVELVGVYDGHSGKSTATFLKTRGNDILKEQLATVPKSPDDISGIETALRVSQHKWLVECPNDQSGATVICSLYIHETNDTYNLSIGDGRWNWCSNVTGEPFNTEMEILDFATDSRKTVTGPTINQPHQMRGIVVHSNGIRCSWRDKHKKVSTLVKNDGLKNFRFDQSTLPVGVSAEQQLTEWTTWLQDPDANPTGFFNYPEYCSGAYRMGGDGMEPTRSLGRNELCIKRGELTRFKIDPTCAMGIFCCDGVDANNATDQLTFGKYVLDFSLANKEFEKGHLGLSELMNSPLHTKFLKENPLPLENSPFKEKLAWLTKSMEPGNPLNHLDNDWKHGVLSAKEYFDHADLEANDAQTIATRMAYYCTGRMSDDNISVAVLKFNIN